MIKVLVSDRKQDSLMKKSSPSEKKGDDSLLSPKRKRTYSLTPSKKSNPSHQPNSTQFLDDITTPATSPVRENVSYDVVEGESMRNTSYRDQKYSPKSSSNRCFKNVFESNCALTRSPSPSPSTSPSSSASFSKTTTSFISNIKERTVSAFSTLISPDRPLHRTNPSIADKSVVIEFTKSNSIREIEKAKLNNILPTSKHIVSEIQQNKPNALACSISRPPLIPFVVNHRGFTCPGSDILRPQDKSCRSSFDGDGESDCDGKSDGEKSDSFMNTKGKSKASKALEHNSEYADIHDDVEGQLSALYVGKNKSRTVIGELEASDKTPEANSANNSYNFLRTDNLSLDLPRFDDINYSLKVRGNPFSDSGNSRQECTEKLSSPVRTDQCALRCRKLSSAFSFPSSSGASRSYNLGSSLSETGSSESRNENRNENSNENNEDNENRNENRYENKNENRYENRYEDRSEIMDGSGYQSPITESNPCSSRRDDESNPPYSSRRDDESNPPCSSRREDESNPPCSSRKHDESNPPYSSRRGDDESRVDSQADSEISTIFDESGTYAPPSSALHSNITSSHTSRRNSSYEKDTDDETTGTNLSYLSEKSLSAKGSLLFSGIAHGDKNRERKESINPLGDAYKEYKDRLLSHSYNLSADNSSLASTTGDSVENRVRDRDSQSSIKRVPPSNPRPLPDQSAFDRSIKAQIINRTPSPPSLGPVTPQRAVCPPTPIRTPYAESMNVEIPILLTAPVGLALGLDKGLDNPEPSTDRSSSAISTARRLSLLENKTLISLSESIVSSNISFTRDFDYEGFLGAGTFADVYRAREKKDGKLYATKKTKRRFESLKHRESLMIEVNIMKKLSVQPCDHLVELIRAWQEDGYFFIQLELAERGTLKDLLTDLAIKKERIPDEAIWRIGHDVSVGLNHIHSHGIVHLDVKPANLLISMDGKIKIGDFGMATEAGKGEDGHEGDTRYMAPELLDSNDRFPPADIFSLGLTLYEVCIFDDHREAIAAGLSCLPAEGPDWHQLRHGQAPALSYQNHSPALRSLISASMQPLPSDRPLTDSILSLPEVLQSISTPDKTLQSSYKKIPSVRSFRSASFNPSFHDPNFASNLSAQMRTVMDDSDVMGEIKNSSGKY